MQGQIFVFLAAGYETTATTLAYMSYYLALNPDVQSKLQNEIDEHFPNFVSSPVNEQESFSVFLYWKLIPQDYIPSSPCIS